MKTNWKKLPDKPGWWWIKYPDDIKEVIQVIDDKEDSLIVHLEPYFYDLNSKLDKKYLEKYYFAGPIPEPKD